MAIPFATLTGLFQHPPHRNSMQISKRAASFLPVSTGESHRGHSEEGTRKGFIITTRSDHGRLYSQNCAEARRRKQHCQVRGLTRLGFWYVKSSVRYILRKARAFYNDFSCDNYYGNPSTAGVDPYFSIPVIHPPNIAIIV